MHLGMSIQYTLKNRDKGYLGITGEHISYGKRAPVALHALLGDIIHYVLCYYIRFQDAETINKSLDKLRTALADLCIVEERPDA